MPQVRKYLGMSHATGGEVVMAIHPIHGTPLYASEYIGDESPQSINEQARELKGLTHSPAETVYAIAEGSLEWCRRFYVEVRDADVLILVNPDEEGLENIGVQVMDKGWKPGDPPVDVNLHVLGVPIEEYVRSVKRRKSSSRVVSFLTRLFSRQSPNGLR